MDEKRPLPLVLIGNSAAQAAWEFGIRGPDRCLELARGKTLQMVQLAIDRARRKAKVSGIGYCIELLKNADLSAPEIMLVPPANDQARKLRELVESRRREAQRESDRANAASDEERRAALAVASGWRAQKISQIAGPA